jgi:hypothetical protein
MFRSGRQESRQALALCVRVGFALGLMAAAPPLAFAQKMYKCSDGKGGTVFQQSPCGETAAEAEARSKERERIQAEEARKKDEAARRKEEQIQKAKERDKVYQEQEGKRAEERKKAEAAERRIIEGAAAGGAAGASAGGGGGATDEGGLPRDMAAAYPAPWKPDPNPAIAKALSNNQIKNCGAVTSRQHSSGSKEFLVRCATSGAHFVVLPDIGGVRPVRF